jgi:hypothetical protein
MTHSTALTKYLKFNRDVIENPEKHFGPNYEAVFNCWAFFDTLTEKQKDLLRSKNLSTEFHSRRVFGAFHSSVVRDASLSQFLGYNMSLALITYEIIGMHILLDQGHSLYFIPLLENL